MTNQGATDGVVQKTMTAVDATDFLLDHFRKISEWVKADPELVANFLKGDDWSLIIRCTAMTEAVLDSAILSVLGKAEIREEISRLPLADSRIGKVRLARKLGIIEAGDEALLRTLAELRNEIAHGIGGISFRFSDSSSKKTVAFLNRVWMVDQFASRIRQLVSIERSNLMALLQVSIVWARCIAAAERADRQRKVVENQLELVELWISSGKAGEVELARLEQDD
ncbi:hypothetical protein [Gemmatimonas sp.]|uniref:hypothetical protein n=1 Tax=Gemmatimonas sp. TaxID=1962908 RepID=UPI003DA25681